MFLHANAALRAYLYIPYNNYKPSRDGVILALLLEQVKLTEAAKALLLLAVVSIVGALIVKKVFKNYSHIKGLAEDFLMSTDVFGAIKEAVSDIADSSCKTDNKKE